MTECGAGHGDKSWGESETVPDCTVCQMGRGWSKTLFQGQEPNGWSGQASLLWTGSLAGLSSASPQQLCLTSAPYMLGLLELLELGLTAVDLASRLSSSCCPCV